MSEIILGIWSMGTGAVQIGALVAKVSMKRNVQKSVLVSKICLGAD